jgi:subtilase family serine protease
MLAPILALLLFAYPGPVTLAAACTGANPAIVTVQPRLASTDENNVNHYEIAVTVQNLGTMKQAGNVLDSVTMRQDSTKVDQKGLQPLAPGQSQTVVFNVARAAGAANGSTHLHFAIKFTQPLPPGDEDCNSDNGAQSLNI